MKKSNEKNNKITLKEVEKLTEEIKNASKDKTRTIDDVKDKKTRAILEAEKTVAVASLNAGTLKISGGALLGAATAVAVSTAATALSGTTIGTVAGGTAAGLVTGATTGAATGAAAGSAVPVVGTAVGAAVGLTIGAVSGFFFKSSKNKKEEEKKRALYQEMIRMQNTTIRQLQAELDEMMKKNSEKDNIIKRQEYILSILITSNDLKNILGDD